MMEVNLSEFLFQIIVQNDIESVTAELGVRE